MDMTMMKLKKKTNDNVISLDEINFNVITILLIYY
jgi:multisubunit Na+/H+ antiporter MnhF subunit